MDRFEEFKINNLIKACFLIVLAQLLLVSELNAQALIFKDSFENCTPGATLVWDGGGDNVSWANPSNWQGNVVPANGDSVSIQVENPQPIVFDNTAGIRSIRCLDSKRALSVTGGNLEIQKYGRISSSVAVMGGSLTVSGRLRAEVQ